MDPSPPLLFSHEWLLEQTGDCLLRYLPMMPEVLETRDAQIIDLTEAKDRADVILIEKVPLVDALPTRKRVQVAIQELNDRDEGCVIEFPGIGAFSPHALRFLLQFHTARSFAESLNRVVEWFKTVVTKLDNVFAQSFLKTIIDLPRLYQKTFCPFYLGPDLHIASVFSVAGGEWLNDIAVSSILTFFQYCYGRCGRYLFVPYTDDRDSRRKQFRAIEAGKVQKVFAIIHMEDHWGAVCFDLKEHKIRFGDSLGGLAPDVAIKRLLNSLCLFDDKWNNAMRNIRTFEVPRQQGGASCGILAAVAIERYVNRNAAWHNYTSPVYHRVRFLRHFTRSITVKEDPIVSAYNVDHIPDDPCQTEREHKHGHLSWLAEEKRESCLALLGEDSQVSDGELEVASKSNNKRDEEGESDIIDNGNAMDTCDGIPTDIDFNDTEASEDEWSSSLPAKSPIPSSGYLHQVPSNSQGGNRFSKRSHSRRESGVLDAGYESGNGLRENINKFNTTAPSGDEQASAAGTNDGRIFVGRDFMYRNSDGDEEWQRMENNKGSSPQADHELTRQDESSWQPSCKYEFADLETAKGALKQYARRCGFDIRINHSKEGSVQLVCTREGFHKPKKHQDPSKRRPNAASHRCNCPFKINMTRPKSIAPKYHITKVILEHNHTLDTKAVEFTPLSPEMLTIIETATDLSLGITKTLMWLERDNPGKVFDMTRVTNHAAQYKATKPQPKVSESFQLITQLASQTPPWFYRHDQDEARHLRAIFWMSPTQQELYHRYHDIVVHGTTASTNRFNMSLHCFVVVDSAFHTRLVACALTSGETTDDYAWVLKQLLIATKDTAPGAIMVDQDLAMTAACINIIPKTRVLNCIWHAGKNLNVHLRPPLGDDWGAFKNAYYAASRSLTLTEFDARWRTLCDRFGDNGGKVSTYLKQIYEDRFRWAWPWVRTIFTASMQSTQRVKKTHHLVKMLGLDSSATLSHVLKATSARITKELFRANETKDAAESMAKQDEADGALSLDVVAAIFPTVFKENEQTLGAFACNKMRREMEWSFIFHTSTSDLQAVLGIHTAGKASSNLRESSLATLVSRLDPGLVSEVFCINDKTFRVQQEYVVLLADNSYFCTCLLLQNLGIVCRHFFCVMQEDSRCKYHLRLVRKRWFKEELQDLPDFDSKLSTRPFVTAYPHCGPRHWARVQPINTFMDSVHSLFSEESAIPSLNSNERAKKRRYADVIGTAKMTASKVAGNPSLYDDVNDTLNKLADVDKRIDHDTDPRVLKSKGRPRSQRIKSSSEMGRSTYRCGACGGRGHNRKGCSGHVTDRNDQ